MALIFYKVQTMDLGPWLIYHDTENPDNCKQSYEHTPLDFVLWYDAPGVMPLEVYIANRRRDNKILYEETIHD